MNSNFIQYLSALKVLAQQSDLNEAFGLFKKMWELECSVDQRFELFFIFVQMKVKRNPKKALGFLEDFIYSQSKWSTFYKSLNYYQKAAVFEWLALLSVQELRYEQCLDYLRRAVSMGRDTQRVWLFMGSMTLSENDFSFSVRCLMRSLELSNQVQLIEEPTRKYSLGELVPLKNSYFEVGFKEYKTLLLELLQKAKTKRDFQALIEFMDQLIIHFSPNKKLSEIRAILNNNMMEFVDSKKSPVFES